MSPVDAIRAAGRSLVQRIGGVDAAAAIIGARTGAAISKGTVSKKVAGSLDFTVVDVIALEDAVGSFPVTTLLVGRMSKDDVAPGCLLEGGANVAREGGEAVSAVLRFSQSASEGERAQAIVEVDEAIASLQKVRVSLVGDT